MPESAPGPAFLRKDYVSGEVTVLYAGPVIRVDVAVLEKAEPWAWDGTTLTLDTAGTYRYRLRGPDPDDPSQALIFDYEEAR